MVETQTGGAGGYEMVEVKSDQILGEGDGVWIIWSRIMKRRNMLRILMCEVIGEVWENVVLGIKLWPG